MCDETTACRLRRVCAVVFFAGLFAWVFFDVLFCDEMFAFRDAGHFYYPLFEFIQAEWSAGRVPLVNPLENDGSPLLANAACSVFYPLKAVFFLPIGFAWGYRVYVFVHVAIAGFWAYRLARHWDSSIEASALCAISYAFCGNVLMQHANVIFLVGAAWLPAAMLAADCMFVERKLRHAVSLGVVLALMTLGGDPQMAYNAGLLAVLYVFFIPAMALRSRKRHVRDRVALLAVAAFVALSLSAIQVIPAAQFTRDSDRAVSKTARSIYEIPNGQIADGLLCRDLDPTTHHGRVYQFSVGPWRLAEYVWPNFSGRQYPINRRWLEAVPAEGRVWTPSLYMGILPLILAVMAMRFRRRGREKPFERWLSWTVVLAVAGGFGWYGLGWLVQEFQLGAGIDAAGSDTADGQLIGPPVGGLYWLMTVLLPGYVYFRYPAKLLVVAAIALSVLAARGWDAVFSGQPLAGFAIRRCLKWLCLFSLLAATVSLAVRPWWHLQLAGTQADVLFGPLDTSGAANDLLLAFLQTALVCAIAWWLLRYFVQRRYTAVVVLALVAVDLGVANAWMVASAPAGLWLQPSKIAQAIRRDRLAHSDTGTVADTGTVRVWRHPVWLPARWQSQGSSQRMAESVRWDRDTLWPKHNLPEGIAIVEVRGTMMPHDYATRLAEAGWPAVMDVTDADYAILPEHERLPGGRRIECGVAGASLWRYEH